MKLELFDFIDETLELIEQRKESINKVAAELKKFFTDSFFINDHFLNVSYRIKSPESLREKILRHNLYLKYKTPENLLNNLSDLIGFRIECRFIEDEKKIYEDIVKLFNIELEDGYFTNPINSSIMLDLRTKQPQKQKNGFEIYKIDGKYVKDSISLNFELQIKSLVNIFWGEIDHRILYKNYNYMLTEDFFRDIMCSIKDSLSMIDRQLMLVYNHLRGMDSSNSVNKKAQLQGLLSKIIHDIYIVKLKKELGFVIDFKKSTDVIVDYIFMKGGPEETENYSANFIRILNRLNEIGKSEISFNKYIDFERPISFNDCFTRKVGNSILEILNKDFRWNLFFKIIFEIEGGNKADDFEGFIIFIRYKFFEGIKTIIEGKSFSDDEKEEILDYLMDAIALSFSNHVDVDFLSECSVKTLVNNINDAFKKIDSYDDWIENKENINNIIQNHTF
ncbi:MAG TPA: (p)ppGpp synthetase [Tissierellaceae bacterium]